MSLHLYSTLLVKSISYSRTSNKSTKISNFNNNMANIQKTRLHIKLIIWYIHLTIKKTRKKNLALKRIPTLASGNSRETHKYSKITLLLLALYKVRVKNLSESSELKQFLKNHFWKILSHLNIIEINKRNYFLYICHDSLIQ